VLKVLHVYADPVELHTFHAQSSPLLERGIGAEFDLAVGA